MPFATVYGGTQCPLATGLPPMSEHPGRSKCPSAILSLTSMSRAGSQAGHAPCVAPMEVMSDGPPPLARAFTMVLCAICSGAFLPEFVPGHPVPGVFAPVHHAPWKDWPVLALLRKSEPL